jgi:hypothetical protein
VISKNPGLFQILFGDFPGRANKIRAKTASQRRQGAGDLNRFAGYQPCLKCQSARQNIEFAEAIMNTLLRYSRGIQSEEK